MRAYSTVVEHRKLRIAHYTSYDLLDGFVHGYP